jgi:diguanylate cyclase (GGDEF)-like protein
LALTVEAMRRVLPPNAFVGRLGGDEFGVLLPGRDLEFGLRVAESMRIAIGACEAGKDGARLRISASIGAALFDGANYASVEQWLAAADQELYAAKRAGRNCVFPARGTSE